MAIPKDVAQKLENLAIMINEKRFSILITLFNSNVLKIGYSLTFVQLKKITGFETNDLSYHLKLLKSAKLVTKNKKNGRYYSITNIGKKLIEQIGFSKNKVMEIRKRI
jgi:predicted transcriptional regulator